ncbi:MAG: fumarylacetoacetate hydrolase family protein [Pseudomonadales bacterium]
MRTTIGVLAALMLTAVLSSVFLSRPAFDESLDENVFDGLSIAPLDQALTLARTLSGKVVLVTEASTDGILAVEVVSASGQPYVDARDAYKQLGLVGLQQLYQSSDLQSLRWSELSTPIAENYPHIAAGTNYRSHAEEVGLDGEPFLFPKLSHASVWNAPVVDIGRLDYEVELCAALLTPHSKNEPAALGYILCGDFTDRWTMVKDMDLGGVMGRTGFPTGKGGDSRLPIGSLLVIPYSDDFYKSIELSLYVNEALRQQTGADKMVWSPQELLARALADCQSPYQNGPAIVYITDCQSIPAGTLILTGTPAGVMFHIATLWSPWAYLQEGDVVTSFGTYLGLLRNEIVDE